MAPIGSRNMVAGKASTGTPTARIMPSGELVYEMPDEITEPVDHWYEFRFRTHRNAMTFAEELFSEIITFVDRLLDAFTAAVPARFRGAG